jgi:hypothetical protein
VTRLSHFLNGNVYRDLDPRERNRMVKVLYVDGHHAVCERVHGTRKTRIRLDRLERRFELVSTPGDKAIAS